MRACPHPQATSVKFHTDRETKPLPTALIHMANRWPDTWRSRRWSKGVYAASGNYFVTICTGRRLCIFGTIEDHQMRLSREGETVHDAWCNLPAHFPHVTLDAFVIMPNHLHGVLNFETEGQSLGTVVGGFKSGVSRTLGKRHWTKTTDRRMRSCPHPQTSKHDT